MTCDYSSGIIRNDALSPKGKGKTETERERERERERGERKTAPRLRRGCAEAAPTITPRDIEGLSRVNSIVHRAEVKGHLVTRRGGPNSGQIGTTPTLTSDVAVARGSGTESEREEKGEAEIRSRIKPGVRYNEPRRGACAIIYYVTLTRA